MEYDAGVEWAGGVVDAVVYGSVGVDGGGGVGFVGEGEEGFGGSGGACFV